MIATLNVTHDGMSQNLCQLDYGTTDDEIRRIAAESLGIRDRNVFYNYVVDKFDTPDGGLMIYLRPKVPFGA